MILTGFVPDRDLVHLYNHALALVLPSLMEGFGLPAVEAMACGTPVLASRAGSLPEVIGDAGLFFDPTDVGSITSVLEVVVSDASLRDRLARKSLARSSHFSWNRAAESLLNCFEELGDRAKERATGAPSILHDEPSNPLTRS